ncbi:hypothetical protein ACFOWM_03725 [Ferruginibacter yonginensis]|uniref:ATP-grasp domain-containing protein n=1 Tax=Ferruginibacter yonginensis TaxID=1310416 RepID=A0ABV8QSS8_9BACT
MKKLLAKITNWEAWPFAFIYAPVAPMWVWYMLKSKAVWFFTPSNPKLTFGGMEGEPKKEMYALLPQHLYPTTFNVQPQQTFESIVATLQQHDIQYPFIVKPEVGGQGILFRKIDDEAALAHYHSIVTVEYIVQQMVHFPIEVSVFHIKHPAAVKGTITGFLHKIPLHVVGDGNSTLEALMKAHPKASLRIDELYTKHQHNWQNIIPVGEKYILSYAANHNRGAHFIDLKHEIDDQLLSIFDGLSTQINDFFYGRYDIMCNSIEELKQGENFTILEYNGCGAEPNHFYDTGYTLRAAHKEILKHWKALYEISKYNAAKGIKPWSFVKGYKFLKATKALMKHMKAVDAQIG